MRKSYRDADRDQLFLLPPSLRDWLPEGHLANFVVDVVEHLDISSIEDEIQARDPRGNRPYSPRMMLAVLFYGYATGVYSSRRIARACAENVAFRVVSGNNQPYFTNVAEFRKRFLPQLGALFMQVLHLCVEAGLIEGRHVHVDGTKIKANASKHRAMSYARMLQTEARLKEEIEELMRRADAADREDDARLGEGVDEDDGVVPEVRRRETRLEWIRRTRERLEDEARRARAAHLRELAVEQDARADAEPRESKQASVRRRAAKSRAQAEALDPDGTSNDDDDDDLPRHRPPVNEDGTPKPEAQRNFTDPDSRIMQDKQGGFSQAYNPHVAVDEASHVILAHGLSNLAPDFPYLLPLLDRVTSNLGRAPETATADAGYMSRENLDGALLRGLRPYLAVHRERRSWPPPPIAEGAPPEGASPKDWMSWMLRTKEGQQRMRKRKSTVELVFGVIKQATGFRQFLLRGLAKVRDEWALVCLGYNLRKLHRAA